MPMPCRIVHGESDGLPGLIVDRYGDYVVVQLLSNGMDRRRQLIIDVLVDLLRPHRHHRPQRRRYARPRRTCTQCWRVVGQCAD
jgi:23S rRNA G2069 N7-methylase RlmK/C1962 C5-methylase RlmI